MDKYLKTSLNYQWTPATIKLISLFLPTWKTLTQSQTPKKPQIFIVFIPAGTQVRHTHILLLSIHSVSLQTWNNDTYILPANLIILPAFKRLFPL